VPHYFDPRRQQRGPALSTPQKDIIASLVWLATERAVRAAATLCEHEGRPHIVLEDLRLGLQREILFGCGPSLERVAKLVAQQRYEECTAEEAEFLREAVANYGTEALERDAAEDDSSEEDSEADDGDSEAEDEREERKPCDCDACRQTRVDAPTAWETWAQQQTPGTFGHAAREAVRRLDPTQT